MVFRRVRIFGPWFRSLSAFRRFHSDVEVSSMGFSTEMFDRRIASGSPDRSGEIHSHSPLLSPTNAWRILRKRTGGHIARSTFYRWLDSGRVYSVRMGSRIYIPWQTLQEVINRCLNGEPL